MWGKIIAIGVIAVIGLAIYIWGTTTTESSATSTSTSKSSVSSMNFRTANFGRINF